MISLNNKQGTSANVLAEKMTFELENCLSQHHTALSLTAATTLTAALSTISWRFLNAEKLGC